MDLFLAISAIAPVAATAYFPVFWLGFGFWRRHRAAATALMLGSLAALCVASYLWRLPLLAPRITALPWLGWPLIFISLVFGTIADRQLGLHVRSFGPLFSGGRIELLTTGAFGVVRHPIYAAGVCYQLGAFAVTGALAVGIAAVVFGAGAAWFSRQEERRLIALLADPDAYAAYRAGVPALFPFTGGTRSSRAG